MRCEICGKKSANNISSFEFLCKHLIDLCSVCSDNIAVPSERQCASCQIEDDIKESEKESLEEEREAEKVAEFAKKAEAMKPPILIPPTRETKVFGAVLNLGDIVKRCNDPLDVKGSIMEIFPKTMEVIVVWPGTGVSSYKTVEHTAELVKVGQKEIN